KKKENLAKENFISFSDHEIQSVQPEDVVFIVDEFHGNCLMKLPDREINFYNWLQEEEPAVWDDLWGDGENEYMISVSLLGQLTNPNSGFQICDLVDQPNYWFCRKHLKPKALELIPSILEKVENRIKLKLHEAFLLTVHENPIDIWHFAYRYKKTIQAMKTLIEELVYQGLLTHLPDREDLNKYFE
ncbi:MAG: hypothetical protein JXB44_09875, partial [Calditrichaceae bacterium]|nr:hypothetical protein [Calditrichaceae bacterium]